MRPISLWLLLLAVVVIVAVTWPLTAWLYRIAGDDPARRIEAIKTGLTAAAGTGGALALLLAFWRQRSTEMIAAKVQEARAKEYEQRDRAADASERDAEQRRITELYTKAADQLGSEKAPVRLAGLHALERLSQITPDQRQTIIDVICAYLRMPYTPPEDQPPAEDASAETHTRHENRRQELQVRMAAQRILGTHLRPEAPDVFWTGINLDLTEAHLHGLDLTGCHVESAHFGGAQFNRNAGFGGTRFGKETVFSGALFGGNADFDEARFSRDACFDGAQFDGDARFGGAQFSGCAGFEAQFSGAADFDEARFDRDAGFGRAHFEIASFRGTQFDGLASFLHAQFDFADFQGAMFHSAWFGGVRFGGPQSGICARFDRAQFSGDARFGGTLFGNDSHFNGARFGGDVDFNGAQFDGDVSFDGARFGRNSLFIKTQFGGDAVFSGARFGGYTDFEAQFSGTADFDKACFDAEDADFEGARARPRHHSWPAGWTSRDARTAEDEEEGWVYLVRIEGGGKQQPDRED